jgi:hypothetical protein
MWGSSRPAVISIQGVTKRFGSHTVLCRTSPSTSPGQDVGGPGAVGHRQVRAPQDHHRAPAARGGAGLHRRRPHGRRPGEGGAADPAQVRRAVPGRRPLRLDEPVRQHRLPLVEHTNKTDKEIRTIVLAKSELVGLVAHLHKLPGEVSGDAQAGRAGPGAGARTRRSSSSTSRTPGSTRCGSPTSTSSSTPSTRRPGPPSSSSPTTSNR